MTITVEGAKKFFDMLSENIEDKRIANFYYNDIYISKEKVVKSNLEKNIESIFGEKGLSLYNKGILRIEFLD